jgi:oligopeptide/dipeptide ABC transporter ATP-binding protein
MLAAKNLTISFPGRGGGLLPAVRELSFSIARGEVLALVGESGSGKSLTALSLMRLLPPGAVARGTIEFEGRELLSISAEEMRRLRGAALAMIFQEPMTALNPVMRVCDQVAEAWAVHNSKSGAWAAAMQALKDAGFPEPERRGRDYPHQLSGGMRQRVMIAMAIVNRPKLLIADEPTTALDVTIQAQILDLLRELREKFNLALLLISHDLAVVGNFAQRVAVMYAGAIVETGAAREVFARPAHPYTRGLLQAAPRMRTDRTKPLQAIEGSVAVVGDLPPGCAFEPRCELRIGSCAEKLPPLVEVGPGHSARCPVVNANIGSSR